MAVRACAISARSKCSSSATPISAICTLVLLLPFVVFALYRRFLPTRWALALVLLFVAVPVGALFGTSFFHYAKWAARGFADPAACIFAFADLLLLIGWKAEGPGRGFGDRLRRCVPVFPRRLHAPEYRAVRGRDAGRRRPCRALPAREWLRLAGLCIGFLPVTSMALHNWYFGGVFVPFSANSTHPLVLLMPPSAYLSALLDLVRFDFGSEYLARGAQANRPLAERPLRTRGDGAAACALARAAGAAS